MLWLRVDDFETKIDGNRLELCKGIHIECDPLEVGEAPRCGAYVMLDSVDFEQQARQGHPTARIE